MKYPSPKCCARGVILACRAFLLATVCVPVVTELINFVVDAPTSSADERMLAVFG